MFRHSDRGLSSKQVVIVVTPERLIVQGTTRKFEAKGEPVSMTPETIAKVDAGGGGGGELQEAGVQAIAEWFQRHAESGRG